VTSFDAESVTRVVKSFGPRAPADRHPDRAANRRADRASASLDPTREGALGNRAVMECCVRLH